MNDYGLSVWGNSNFVIENGEICVNSDSKPALIDMINQIRTKGINAVYPLKVNQYPGFVKNLIDLGKPYKYGLEAGSKAELLLAMAYNNFGAPITVNGFKDKELINIGFIAAEMGHNITLTIEGLNELEAIIATAKARFAPKPNIGLRIRLHSSGSGAWAKSGGMNAKFGLTSTELIEAINMLKNADLLSIRK